MDDFRDRRVIALLRSELERVPVVILGGIRGGGKTAVLRHGFEGTRRYLSLADLRMRRQARQRPHDFLQGLTGPTTLDQVETAPELLTAVLEWCADAQDGVARDGAAHDGAARDGAARDGAARDGTARDGAARDPVNRPRTNVSRTCLTNPPVAGSLLLGLTPSGLLDSDTLRAGLTKPASPRGHAVRLGWDAAGCPKIDSPMVSYVTQWSLSSSEIEPHSPDDDLERFARGLIRGGMPGPGWRLGEQAGPESARQDAWIDQEAEAWKQWNHRYWNGLLGQDFTRLLRPASRGAFERFLVQMAQDCGRPVNYTRWAQAAGVTTNTARVWWRLLMLSGLAYINPSISERSGPGGPWAAGAKAPRGYLSDTGLLASLLGITDSEEALTGAYADRLLLTYVGGELMRLASDAGEADSGDGAVLFHWRPAQQTGVDFIFESEGRVHAVICTTSPEPSRAQIGAVEQLARGVAPTSRGPALAICYRERAERVGGIQLLPAPRLRLFAA